MNREPAGLRRRAEYTHRFNVGAGRHGWLRLTPAYSRRVVEEILARYRGARRVLDPFGGTGTTALSAANAGHDAVTTDINPFLVWFMRTKVGRYDRAIAARVRGIADEAVGLAGGRAIEPEPPPAMHNISRWWRPEDLEFLALLKAALARLAAPGSPESDLLRVAFCRLLVRLSNAAFDHQSMSFRPAAPRLLAAGPDRAYEQETSTVLASAIENPVGRVEVIEADATRIDPRTVGSADLVITSPPYVNRMSYVRELRPYMYWLDYFEKPRDAGELDWAAVGGTWGIATSRLARWQPNGAETPDEVQSVLGKIRATGRANAGILAKYVEKYFEDLGRHFRALRPVLRPGARVHYIIGNSVLPRLRRSGHPAAAQAELEARTRRVRGVRRLALNGSAVSRRRTPRRGACRRRSAPGSPGTGGTRRGSGSRPSRCRGADRGRSRAA